MADHMPAWFGAGMTLEIAAAAQMLVNHARPFDQLLCPAFAEVGQAQFEGGADHVDLDQLGDAHQTNVFDSPAAALTSGGDPVTDALHIFGEFSSHGMLDDRGLLYARLGFC